MKLIAVGLIVTILTGCAAGLRPSTRAEVAAMPNDCANKRAIIAYLEEQTQSKPFYMSNADWANSYSALRTKIWEMRTVCQ